MADCSTLLDEDLESFVFNYLSDSPKPGEESLSLDFPEIDLSQLDASDFDSNSCFDELQWCNDHSEIESSQYSTEDSELFQIIESENEALLAALTQTLDDIQDDDISLSAFISSGDGDFCPLPDLSPKPSIPAESPKSPETEDELSILKKLLLSPAQLPTSSDTHKDGSSRRRSTSKFRPQRTCSKVESPTDRQPGNLQAQGGRSCIELQRHLVSTLQIAQATESCSKNEDSVKEEDSDSYEEEQSEDESLNSLSPTLEDRKPQFTCEREKRAVVDLIRYMHTYCLPIKKHHNDEKHQHCNSLLKRPKQESSRQTRPCSNQGSQLDSANGTGSCHAVDKFKRTKPSLARFSILKELLAKDISGDVSKPYRLAQPVYAAFSNSCGSRLPQGKTEPVLARGIKTESLKKENKGVEQDSGKSANVAQEHVTVKGALKQGTPFYAVRRSSRLNPEFSEWLWISEESSPQAAANIQPTPAAQAFCMTTEPFGDEEQMAEIEVGDVTENSGLVQDERVQEDLEALDRDLSEAHNDIGSDQFHPLGNPRCPSLSLLQNDSSFEKRNFEQALTAELCGTAGLTPPTTPPYKPTEEDVYKPQINQGSIKSESLITSSSKVERTEDTLSTNSKVSKKHPERTELFAHLSRTAELTAKVESHGVKRPFSRSFGDHDYCLVRKPETSLHRKMFKSLDLPSHVERKPKLCVPPVQQGKMETKTESSLKEGSKPLKDHEIRASLTKHFGFPDNPLKDSDAICSSPEYDSVFEDSGSECGSTLEDEVCLIPRRTKIYSQRSSPSKANGQCYPHIVTSPRSSRHNSPDGKRTIRCESSEQRQIGNLSQRQIQKRRQKAIDEGRVIYIRNLSNSISANELKRRFEVFGEILECRVLSKSRGEKYGFITYRHSEHAALSLKKGASLRKRNEPSFQLSYGGLRHFFWTKYTDLGKSFDHIRMQRSPRWL
ncbi:peroxisome proliferator-activated receptor gamma coactivator 1-beta isoform 1-T1 [Discoglossus pictus]